jgi:hypothetical protein
MRTELLLHGAGIVTADDDRRQYTDGALLT